MADDDRLTLHEALGYLRGNAVRGAEAEELAHMIVDGGCVLFASAPEVPTNVTAFADRT